MNSDAARRDDLLAPGSPTYRVMADAVTWLYVPMSSVVLSTMRPKAGQAIQDHEPLVNGTAPRGFGVAVARLRDSLELVGGIVLAADEADREHAAHALRELHRIVGGDMPDGSRYHAWDRDLWASSWACIFKALLDSYESMRGYPSIEFRDQALAGMVELGRRFGVRGLPDTWDEFDAYWTDYMVNLAETNISVEYLFEQIGPNIIKPASMPWLPQPAWRALTAPLRHHLRVGVTATFPDVLDDRLGFRRTRLDALEVRLHRALWSLVPRAATESITPSLFRLLPRLGHTMVWERRFSTDQLAERRTALTIPTRAHVV